MKKSIYDKYIIGISYGFHDSAVALIKNGKVLNAVEEERFTGIKHDYSFPINSINMLYSITKNTQSPSSFLFL